MTTVTFPASVSTVVQDGTTYTRSVVETLTITPAAAPPVPVPPCYAVSGQSNMVNLLAGGFFTAAGIPTFGFAMGAEPISYWDIGQDGWTNLLAALTAHACTATRIVWFQGESDDLNGATAAYYVPKLVDLIARIRAALNQPTVPALICGIAARFTTINQALAAAVAQIPGATLIPTADLEHADDRHLDNAGATALVQRLLAA